jgi:hypothetical protein
MYREWVRLHEHRAIGGFDLVLVEVAQADAGYEQLLDAARRHPLHRMPAAVPTR